MSLLLSIVRNIALLVLISSFWELLAPRGSLRGPVRLVMGLLLVSCVVLPITDAITRGVEPWLLELPEQYSPEETLEQGREIAGLMQDEAWQNYEKDVARQVAAMCMLSDDVLSARAAVEGNAESGMLERVQIEADLAAGADITAVQDRLSQLIGTFFSVEEIAIECIMEEALADGGKQETGE